MIDAGIGQIPKACIEAAQLAGASGPRIAGSIVVPLIARHLVVALAATFVLSTGEIGSTILLYPPGGETLPIALYAIEANSPRSLVAALTLILALMPVAAALAVIAVLQATRLVRTSGLRLWGRSRIAVYRTARTASGNAKPRRPAGEPRQLDQRP